MPAWIRALTSLVTRHVQGWPTQAADQPAPAELAAQRERARAMGSPD